MTRQSLSLILSQNLVPPVHIDDISAVLLQTTGTAAQIEGPHHLYRDLQFKVVAITSDGIISEETPYYPTQDAVYGECSKLHEYIARVTLSDVGG